MSLQNFSENVPPDLLARLLNFKFETDKINGIAAKRQVLS